MNPTFILRFLFGLILFSPMPAMAQCPAGGITLKTQAEIDAFPATYPNCHDIIGSLIIEDSLDLNQTDIQNLDSLYVINSISGTLRIYGNPQLTDISGFSGLHTIGGDIYIFNNDASGFTDLAGLTQLTSVGGAIDIQHNQHLQTFDGINNVTGSLGGNIKIARNPSLIGMEALKNIGSVGGNLFIKLNNQLTHLQGLESITTVTGWVSIQSNAMMQDISQLSSILTIGDFLTVGDNPLLSNCEGTCTVINNAGIGSSLNVWGNKLGGDCESASDIYTVCASILPVSLVYFEGRSGDSETNLFWETETELNNAGFYIERSQDGRQWQTIGWEEGHGTTSLNQAYSFVDRTPHSGVNYYRLKQVDYDGQFEYSPVISVDYYGQKTAMSIYPNPANNQVFIQHHLTGDVVIRFYNQFGKLTLYQANPTNPVDVSSLPTGIYMVLVSNEYQESERHKILISD